MHSKARMPFNVSTGPWRAAKDNKPKAGDWKIGCFRDRHLLQFLEVAELAPQCVCRFCWFFSDLRRMPTRIYGKGETKWLSRFSPNDKPRMIRWFLQMYKTVILLEWDVIEQPTLSRPGESKKGTGAVRALKYVFLICLWNRHRLETKAEWTRNPDSRSNGDPAKTIIGTRMTGFPRRKNKRNGLALHYPKFSQKTFFFALAFAPLFGELINSWPPLVFIPPASLICKHATPNTKPLITSFLAPPRGSWRKFPTATLNRFNDSAPLKFHLELPACLISRPVKPFLRTLRVH